MTTEHPSAEGAHDEAPELALARRMDEVGFANADGLLTAGAMVIRRLHARVQELERAALASAAQPAVQGDAEDAARYRWLRQIRLCVGHGDITVYLDDRTAGRGFQRHKSLWGEELDAAIDAARAQAKEGASNASRPGQPA